MHCMAMCSKHATRIYPLACICKDVRMSKHLCMLYMAELWLPWVAAYVCIGADDTMMLCGVGSKQVCIGTDDTMVNTVLVHTILLNINGMVQSLLP